MPTERDGNLAGLEYTYGYFSPLSPTLLGLCALSKGVRFEAGNRALRYLELGFGQGVSLVVHAASTEGEFWGNDIGLAHVEHARALAASMENEVRVLPDSFEQLLCRQDLPQFDVITLHGIWSWVSDEDGRRIVELAKRHLAPGGLLYVSYNCSAGWAAANELRQLLIAHAECVSAGDPATAKVERAMAFARELAAAGAAYFRANPTVVAQLQAVSGRNSTYLAHEFLGDHWRLASFYEVAGAMRSAGLEFLGSAFFLEHGDRFTLDEPGRALVDRVEDPLLKEMAIECFINPQFRQDVFVKEPIAMSADERRDAFLRQRFMLTIPIADTSLTISGPRSQIALERALYEPLLAALAAEAHIPKRLSEIVATLRGIDVDELIQAMIVLVGAGYVQPAVEAPSDLARTRCAALNARICARARDDGRISVLASPVLGAGIRVMRADQLFLLARANGASSPQAWADFAMAEVAGAPPDLRDKVVAAARSFQTQTLPILIAAGVA